ncbi:hypothetical protein AAFF_G00078420 [Aldrovandia affinis]|uniref:Uncharacterized protein n=1 Tax=Aldrovandia affinis TaxID=143900 RepID=A0AAD7R260_9TELE|nr:hypothetical protein AAFF_G00078420 [Aldrovandia affinis]
MQAILLCPRRPGWGAVFGPGGHGFDCDADEARHGSGGDTAGADVGAAEDGDGELAPCWGGKVVITVGGLSVELEFSSPHLPAVHPCPHQQPRSHPVPPSPGAANMEEEADRPAVCEGICGTQLGHLEPEQQEELWQLLTEFKGIFALTDAEIGRTHLVHHQIDTGAPGLSDHHPAAFPWRTEKLQSAPLMRCSMRASLSPLPAPWAREW